MKRLTIILSLLVNIAYGQYYDVIDSLILKSSFQSATITEEGNKYPDRIYYKDKDPRFISVIEKRIQESVMFDSIHYEKTELGVIQTFFFLNNKSTEKYRTQYCYNFANHDSVVTFQDNDTAICLISKRITDTANLFIRKAILNAKFYLDDSSSILFYEYDNKNRLIKYGLLYSPKKKTPKYYISYLKYNDVERTCLLTTGRDLHSEKYYFNKKGLLYKIETWTDKSPVNSNLPKQGRRGDHNVYNVKYINIR